MSNSFAFGGINAVLIVTGLSPDAHAAANDANPAAGWWEAMVGPGKAIDTDRWHVICVNSLGSCKGSTGPASIDPATGDLVIAREGERDGERGGIRESPRGQGDG